MLGSPNQLLRNNSFSGNQSPGFRFTDVAAQAKVTEPEFSFPTWFFDYDNDGWEDIFVGGYGTSNVGDMAADFLGLPHTGETPRLYRNNRDGTFADVTRELGLNRLLLAMGCNFADYDNDGWLDFYLGTGEPDMAALMPNRLFRNNGAGRFLDVTASARVGHLQKGHGLAFADFDHDGDLDIYQSMGGAFSGDLANNVLYENSGTSNRWIEIELQGVRANRPGIGARIRLTLDTAGGSREIHRTATTGGSFGSSPFRQHIGVGRATSIRQLQITWPGSGVLQTVNHPPMDQVLRVREEAPQNSN